ncbi:MAG: response regulator [Armatimonadetes bacterium]|nr:response regulator [Armatimonadota bacterium]
MAYRGKVVVIADDPMVTPEIRDYLRSGEFEIFESRPDALLPLLSSQSPHALLIGVSPPDFSALSMIESIRPSSQGKPCLVIALMREYTRDDEERILRSGVDGFLLLPVSKGEFLKGMGYFVELIKDERGESQRASSRRHRILVVDDDPSIQKLLKAHLSLAGFEVIHALNGEDGLKVAVADRPDLILLDVMMPGMKGFEVCQQLKSQEETGDIPVIFLTSLSAFQERMEGLKSSADDYIAKPFVRSELLARIRALLRTRESSFI